MAEIEKLEITDSLDIWRDKINNLCDKFETLETSYHKIGDIWITIDFEVPADGILFDGREYLISGEYASFWEWVKINKAPISSEDYNTYISTYGVCPFFAHDEDSNYFLVPTLTSSSEVDGKINYFPYMIGCYTGVIQKDSE